MHWARKVAALVAAATLWTVSTSVASAASGEAPTSAVIPTAVQQQLSAAPADVQAWVHSIADKGGKIQSLATAPYQRKSSSTGVSTASPASLPTGCGLWVVIYMWQNIYVSSSSLTSCNYLVSEIYMESGIALKAWWGWDEMKDDEATATVVSNLSLQFNYNCKGSGTHDWQTVTNGDIETLGGVEYTADAYDWFNATCPN